MKKFLPEGMLIDTPANRLSTSTLSGLGSAQRSGQVLEATALLCNRRHDLVVDLGDATGVIPREESALGLDTGETKEIAILSRVGKPVSFIVEGIDFAPEGKTTVRLSRRLAQKLVLDYLMNELNIGDVIPAVVTHLAPFGAFVDVGCGFVSMIGIENISVSRISRPTDRFSIGQSIYAVINGRQNDRIILSHKELLGTWEENAGRFSAGETVSGIVRGVKEYGIFVELSPNLSGLAEFRPGVNEGQRVSVYIKSILPERMKVKLVIIDVLGESTAPPAPPEYYITSGNVTDWKYA